MTDPIVDFIGAPMSGGIGAGRLTDLEWQWRCHWCGAIARFRRDLQHAATCRQRFENHEVPEKVAVGNSPDSIGETLDETKPTPSIHGPSGPEREVEPAESVGKPPFGASEK